MEMESMDRAESALCLVKHFRCRREELPVPLPRQGVFRTDVERRTTYVCSAVHAIAYPTRLEFPRVPRYDRLVRYRRV